MFPLSGEMLGTLSRLHSFLDKLSMVIRALPTFKCNLRVCHVWLLSLLTMAKLDVLTVCGPPGEETLGLASLDSVLDIFSLGVRAPNGNLPLPFIWYLESWDRASFLVCRP